MDNRVHMCSLYIHTLAYGYANMLIILYICLVDLASLCISIHCVSKNIWIHRHYTYAQIYLRTNI